MTEEIRNLECINDLLKLEQCIKEQQIHNLLDLFGTYVFWSNPDYKYNETYLKDMIPKFLINIKKYSFKLEFREKILEELQKINIPQNSKCELFIEIDGIWELIFDNKNVLCSHGWEKLINETPNLNLVDANYTYIKCQFNSLQESSFSDYLISENEEQLKKFAVDSLKSFVERLER